MEYVHAGRDGDNAVFNDLMITEAGMGPYEEDLEARVALEVAPNFVQCSREVL